MDWMGHVCVNAPVRDVIGFMGSLYAKRTVLGEWLLYLDKLPEAISRVWIFQEMAFGPLDKEATGELFEQLRTRGSAISSIPIVDGGRRNKEEDEEALRSYVLGCACVASLLSRRAFAVNGKHCEWFQAICPKPEHDVYNVLLKMKFSIASIAVTYHDAKQNLPNLEESLFSRMLVLCLPQPILGMGWDGAWKGHRAELLARPRTTRPPAMCTSWSSPTPKASSVQRWGVSARARTIGRKPSPRSCRPLCWTSSRCTKVRVGMRA